MDYINTNTYSGQAEVILTLKAFLKDTVMKLRVKINCEKLINWICIYNRMMNMLRSHAGTYFKFAYYHLEGCYLEHLWTPSSTPTWKIFSNKLTQIRNARAE